MRPSSRPSTPANFCIGHLEDGLHAAFASSVRGVHVRRRSLERRLDDYYHRGGSSEWGEGRTHPLVVAGGAGSGKSSSLAEWTARRREEAEDGERGDLVFYHAAGCSRNSVSVGQFLRRAMVALKGHFDLPTAVDENDARLPWTFPRILEQAAKKGQVLIVLDGLHHMRPLRGGNDDETQFNLKWLPRSFPSNVRVVLSMTTCEDEGAGDPSNDHNAHVRQRCSKLEHVVQEAQRRKWPIVPIGEFSKEHVEDLVDTIQRVPLDNYDDSPNSGPREPICFTEPMMGVSGSRFTLPSPIREIISSCTLAKNPQCLTTLLRALAYSSRQGFDLWTYVEQWTDEAGDAGHLINMVLDDIETGHQTNPATSERAMERLATLSSSESDDSQGYTSDFSENSDESDAGSHQQAVLQRGDCDAPIYLRGGRDVEGLGPVIGHALALLFVSRHGLHERELLGCCERVRKNEKWLQETQDTILPIELKIFRSLAMNKNRLIDVFRSFDTDGSGTLSHEEIYKGMEQLDVGVDHSDVAGLIKVVDTNQDGELDYREMMEHFEDHSKRYMHGKRRESLVAGGIVGSTKGSARKTVRLSSLKTSALMNPKCREALLSALISLGVTYVRSEGVLILPLESTALRDVVWSRYIGASKKGEGRWHSVLIDFFSRQDPNLRRCEELPWHLRKCSRYLALRQTLVDLRTFDIMYNNGMSFRAELFDYLRLLTDGTKDASPIPQDGSAGRDNAEKKRSSRTSSPPFDPVDEYNHAVELWYHETRPSAVRLAAMCCMIGNFMKWFSVRMSSYSTPPPFMRNPLDLNKLRSIGLDELCSSKQVGSSCEDVEEEVERPLTRGSVQNFSEQEQMKRTQNIPNNAPYYMYFFDRWIWLQYPWMALKNAPLHCSNMRKEREGGTSENDEDANTSREEKMPTTPAPSRMTSSPKSNDRHFWELKKEDPYDHKIVSNTIRDSAMARSECSKKSASMQRVDKLQSTALTAKKDRKRTGDTANVPFAYSTARAKKHGSRYPSAKMMHHDSVRCEEEKLDSIARKATERFGGQSHPRDFEDVIDVRREEEACASASRGLSASHTSAHSTFVLTQHELEIGRSLQKVADLRDLFDKLKLEAKSKEERSRELENSVAERDLGDRQTHEKVVAGEEILNMLQERLDRLNALVQDASSLREFFRKIALSLNATNPAHHKKHLRSLEQQIALSRQQKEDLLKTKHDIFLEIESINQTEKTRWRDMRRSSDEKRSKIQRQLKAMRRNNEAPAPEVCEHRPTIRSPLLASKKSFSSRASKLIALDAIGRRKSKASQNELDRTSIMGADANNCDETTGANNLHPMEILIGMTGSFDPVEISQKIIQSKDREAELRNQQSDQEEIAKSLKKKLHGIHDEFRECKLTEDDISEESTASIDMRMIDEEVRNAESTCVHHAKQTEKVLALTSRVESGISHLVDMAICNGCDLISNQERASSLSGAPREDEDVLGCLQKVEEHLCSLVHKSKPQGHSMESTIEAASPADHKGSREATVWWSGLSDAAEISDDDISNPCSPSQIRVLNRKQIDLAFEKKMNTVTVEEDRKIELEEKSRAGFDLEKENEHISTFVNEALLTRESRTEQRRANILSHSKQGKYADRGLIMEAVLKRASEELCQEPRDRPKSGAGGRVVMKEDCKHIVQAEAVISHTGAVSKPVRA